MSSWFNIGNINNTNNSLAGVGPVLDTHYMVAGIPSTVAIKRSEQKYYTAGPIWHALTADLQQCSRGVFDELDSHGLPQACAGLPICGGHRLCHMFDRNDLEYHCNEKGLRHWRCNNPCFKCPANVAAGHVLRWTGWAGLWKQLTDTAETWT